MSRARDRQKKRAREAWANRRADRYAQARMRAMFPVVVCNECHGSGRAPDHGWVSHGNMHAWIGSYQMCRRCGGDGKVRAGTIHINVTI
jgi:DnaJ-class molecular chaperone